MAESAIRYFRVPKDVKTSFPNQGVKEGEYSFRQFFTDHMLARLPRGGMDDLAIVRSLARLASALAGAEFELPEEHWARLRNALPPVAAMGQAGVVPELYLQALSFWEAVWGAGLERPEDWGQAA